MRAEEFAASIGFDALRISMGGKPRLHDVDTICRWLRHVSAQGIEAEGRNAEGSSVHESPSALGGASSLTSET